MEIVTVEFTPTREDYVGGMRAFLASYKAMMWGMLPALALIFLTGCFGLFLSLYLHITSAILWLLLIFLAGLFSFAVYVIMPFQTGIQVQRQERLRSPTSYTFDDEKVVIKNQFIESKMDWGSLEMMIETRKFYLFIYKTNQRMFHILPKRAFSSPVVEAEFRSLATAHIRIRQDETRGWTVAKVSLIITVVLLATFTTIYAILLVILILLRR